MIEKIGKVTLDYEYYPGKDLYCDGTIEKEILNIVQQHPAKEYGEIIEERANWPILYHLSHQRANIIDWLPMDHQTKVLEVGSGCGAITGRLTQKAGDITCIDLSKQRSMINATRNADAEHLYIHVGNFQDVEKTLPCDYDYILLIGVFEYGQGYIGGSSPYTEFMKILKKHLKPEGRLVIAIENRLGLKYWAGCREDHLGTFFTGLEGYSPENGVRTFGHRELEDIMKQSGIEQYSFYYPYPDYKFPTVIYSDKRLPKVGELTENQRNFDRDRLLLFDEKKVFDALLEEREFPLFSNSFMVICGPEIPTIYSKFSNDRAPQYAIRTDIVEETNGERYVEKRSYDAQAGNHVMNMQSAFQALQQCFEGTPVMMNQCIACPDTEKGQKVLRFPYIEGVTLEELLDRAILHNQTDEFLNLLKMYCNILQQQSYCTYCDRDLIFSNILIANQTWHIIDYEWSSTEQMSASDVFCRAIYCYLLCGEERNQFIKKHASELEEFGYSEAGMKKVREKEMQFQKKVTGDRLSMREIGEKIGNRLIVPNVNGDNSRRVFSDTKRTQIYLDYGNGFSEQNSYFMEENERVLDLTLPVSAQTVRMRIDPCMEPCMVYISKVEIQGKKLKYTTNGKKAGPQLFAFTNNDPNIIVGTQKKGMEGVKLHIVMEVMPLPQLLQ